MEYYINTDNFKQLINGEPITIEGYNRPLGMHKTKGKYIITDILTGLKVIESNTIKEALTEFKSKLQLINNELNSSRIKNIEAEFKTKKTQEQFNNLIKEFENIFDIDYFKFINQLAYGILGVMYLDITKFDDYLKYEPDYFNMSLKEYITKKYGNHACQVVQELAHINKNC